jgi:hypothetical protein
VADVLIGYFALCFNGLLARNAKFFQKLFPNLSVVEACWKLAKPWKAKVFGMEMSNRKTNLGSHNQSLQRVHNRICNFFAIHPVQCKPINPVILFKNCFRAKAIRQNAIKM